MIIHDVTQGTPEWHAARLGIPTASNFHKIISPTGKRSAQALGYAKELLAEMMTGEYEDLENKSIWMERGTELEDSAAQLYAFKHGVELLQVGFVTDDARTAGCSPDRLIGALGGLEIKCPKAKTHVSYILEQAIDEDHKPQVQGTLAVLGLEWWDVMSYHPRMDPVIIRARRDEAYICAFNNYLADFHYLMEEKKVKLIKMGYFNQ